MILQGFGAKGTPESWAVRFHFITSFLAGQAYFQAIPRCTESDLDDGGVTQRLVAGDTFDELGGDSIVFLIDRAEVI